MSQVSDKVDGIRERLVYEIGAGVFKALDKFPGERALAEKYSVSRNTVRQALFELEGCGIIERVPSSGAYISANALEKIAQRHSSYKMKVALLLPPDQISNPIIQNIFTVFRNDLDPAIKTDVIFVENDIKSLSAVLDADVGIVFAVTDMKLLNDLRRKVRHLILLNSIHEEFNYIAPDNYSSGRQVAEYLIDNGHREIGGLCYNDKDPSSDFFRRMQGAGDVFEEAGIRFSPYLVKPDFFFRRKVQNEIHAAIAREGFTAYIGGCDRLAIELSIALNRSGRSIPGDVSVIGFDDQFYAAFTLPPLTTIKYPIEAIGIKLAETVNRCMLTGECCIQEQIVLVLLKRNSVRNISLEKNSF